MPIRKNKEQTKFFFFAFYLAAIVLVVFHAWNEQNEIRQGGHTPLYRNLMEHRAYIRRGFDLGLINPRDFSDGYLSDDTWVRFESSPPRVMDSPLPDLPKRPLLSPRARATEEFTIVIPVEMDNGLPRRQPFAIRSCFAFMRL